MEILRRIIATLPDARLINVTVGLFFTAVEVEIQGEKRCGLAATLTDKNYDHGSPAITGAGQLEFSSTRELVNLALSDHPTEASVGVATINALLPCLDRYAELAAEDYIAQQGRKKKVAVIGHFPFITKLKDKVKELWVLELEPREGDLPAERAPQIIPQADILAITATTLINHTFEGVMALRKPGAQVILLGPSTPLTSLFFEFGVNVLSGSYVIEPEKVLRYIRQGATFRQIRPQGVRLVTIESKR